MKTFLEMLNVTFSMFSRVPVRRIEWTPQNRKNTLAAFPLVGLLTGLCWILVLLLCTHFGVPALLTGAFLTGLPLLVVGGIHLDGYLDTCDALGSHAPKEKKLQILSDPHTGAFAVIHGAVFLVLWFAASTVLAERGSLPIWILTGLCFALSRTLSGLSVTTFPLAKNTGLAHAFAETADKKTVRSCLFFWLVLLLILIGLLDLLAKTMPAGLLICCSAALMFFRYRYTAVRQFGGTTGDLAGWFLSLCELWMLVAAALVSVT